MGPRLLALLFCTSTHRDENGRHIDGVIFQLHAGHEPGVVTIWIYMLFTGLTGEHRIQFQTVMHGAGTAVAEQEIVPLDGDDPDAIVEGIPIELKLTIESPGTMEVIISVDGAEVGRSALRILPPA
jgi:hypothetical protein